MSARTTQPAPVDDAPDASPLVRIAAPTAAAVCRGYLVRRSARALLNDTLIPLHFLDRLVAAEEFYPDAVDFLAHALPKRETVWWGCLCLWLADGAQRPLPEQRAVAAAVRWVLEPNEVKRQAAEPLATAATGSAAGFLALAVGRSGGSLVAPNLPPVEPPPTLTGDTVAAALHLAPVAAGPPNVVKLYRQFIALGIGVAQGKHSWVAPKKTAPAEGQPFWPGQTW